MSLTAVLAIFKYKETLLEKGKSRLEKIKSDFKVLLKNKVFCLYGVISGILFGFIVNYFTVSPFILRTTYHVEPLHVGFYLLLLPISLIPGSVLASYLAKKKLSSRKLLVLYSILFLALSVSALPFALYTQSVVVFITMSVLTGFIAGLMGPLIIGESMAMAGDAIGLASAVQAMIKLLTTALSMLLASIVHVKTTADLAVIFLILSGIMNLLFILLWVLSNKWVSYRLCRAA